MKDIFIIYGILFLFCIVAILSTNQESLLLVIAWVVLGLIVSGIFWLIAKVLSACIGLLFRRK